MNANLVAMQTQTAVPDDVVDVVLTASRVLIGIADRAMPETAEVTLHQFRALLLLDAQGDMGVNELAEVLGVSASTVTRLCDRLVRKRLIRRRHGRDNRRQVSISVSPTGAALVAEVVARRRQGIADVLARLDARERAEVAGGLAAFIRASHDEPGESGASESDQ